MMRGVCVFDANGLSSRRMKPSDFNDPGKSFTWNIPEHGMVVEEDWDDMAKGHPRTVAIVLAPEYENLIRFAPQMWWTMKRLHQRMSAMNVNTPVSEILDIYEDISGLLEEVNRK